MLLLSVKPPAPSWLRLARITRLPAKLSTRPKAVAPPTRTFSPERVAVFWALTRALAPVPTRSWPAPVWSASAVRVRVPPALVTSPLARLMSPTATIVMLPSELIRALAPVTFWLELIVTLVVDWSRPSSAMVAPGVAASVAPPMTRARPRP